MPENVSQEKDVIKEYWIKQWILATKLVGTLTLISIIQNFNLLKKYSLEEKEILFKIEVLKFIMNITAVFLTYRGFKNQDIDEKLLHVSLIIESFRSNLGFFSFSGVGDRVFFVIA